MTGKDPKQERIRIPRDADNDYTVDSARKRREFVQKKTGADLSHVSRYSFDSAIVSGNVENFIGAAQVPIGIAGPLRINGEHAQGDFYVPLATTEGTLVASYNRGMRLLTECDGVKTTVVDEHMQRAPVFILGNAREARTFGQWIDQNFQLIKNIAEATTQVGKLTYIGQYAEVVLKKEILKSLMGVDTADLFKARQVSMVGAFLVASANNGAHAANGLTALFIATGQDVATISESHAGVSFHQLLDNGDYYWSMTLPALIVATFGGGTHLATQRECLNMQGCLGQGKVNKFAEICAAVVLAGETSLAGAVLHGDWVSSHEKYGRNR